LETNISINFENISKQNFDKNNKFETISKEFDIEKLKNDNEIKFEKTVKNDFKNNLYYDLSLEYFLPVKDLKQLDE
jgi:hypothetical protein